MLSRGVVLALGLAAAGCMISDQVGQLIPDGDPRYWDQKLGEVSFRFDTGFNRAVVFGRSAVLALLALLALWFFRESKLPALLVGLPLLAGAGFLLYLDLPTLLHYRIAAMDDGLVIEIPPAPRREVPWDGIESLTVRGWQVKRESPGPLGPNPFLNVPEWEVMTVHLPGGEVIDVDLQQLSWEQRQSVWKAIVVRSKLVPVK